MKYFALDLMALSPLAIRADHAQEGVDAISYISGTTLVGSLAAVHRFAFHGENDNFERLFLSGQAQFPDLYPGSFKNSGMQDATALPVFPFPKTARTCKRFSGFKFVFGGEEEKPGERHGVRDSLLEWAMFALADQTKGVDPSILLHPFQETHQCPSCKNTMEYAAGYYRRNEAGNMIAATSKTRLQTHTGINRSTGTVQEGILYNRRVFDEHTRFWGMLKIDDELTPTFEHFISEFGTSGLIRVGTGRTRGMGKVALRIKPIEDNKKRSDVFSNRLQTFNKALQDTAQTFSKDQKLPLDLKPFYFALTLHSPVILRDHLLRYRGVITEKALAELLGLPAEHFKLLYRDASTRRVTGWNELWGTPRTNEIAIDTASVFLYESTLPQDKLEDLLFKIENEGIGQRRTEGFGRISISDPFHKEVELR